MSLSKLLLLEHSCMYAKRGGVAAYHIVWIGLCLTSVPGVRVLASANQLSHPDDSFPPFPHKSHPSYSRR